MIILAIDIGHVRTGTAICDPTGLIASPIGTITERRDEVLLEKLAALAAERRAERIVVGHPRNMDGSCGESAKRCEELASRLAEMTGIETVLWDERLTTVSAIGYLNQTDTRGKKRKAVVDTVSAVIILEDYLRSLR